MINSGDGAGVGGQPEVEVTESVTRGSSDSVDLLVAALQQVCDQRRMTLAVAESLTSGAIQAAIGRHRGVSGFFLGGVVTYDIAVKRHIPVSSWVRWDEQGGMAAANAKQAQYKPLSAPPPEVIDQLKGFGGDDVTGEFI